MGATREKTSIKLYTGSYCPYCRRVKQELDRLDLDCEAVDADADGRDEVIGEEVLVDSSHIIRELRKRYA